MDFNNQNQQNQQTPNFNQPTFPGGAPSGAEKPPFGYAPFPPMQRKARPKPIFTRLDFFAFPIVFVLFYAFLKNLFEEPSTAYITIAYWGIFAVATACIVAKTKRFPLKAVFPGAICLLSSLSFAFHDDSLVKVGVVLLLVLFSGIYCICLTDSNVHSSGSIFFLLDVIRCELLLPVEHIFMPGASMHNSFRFKRKEKKPGRKPKKKIIPIILGIAAGAVILAIVMPLLIESDAVFEKLIGSTFENIGKYLEKMFDFILQLFDIEWGVLILTLIFTPYLFSVIFTFGSGVAKSENRDTSTKYRKLRKLPVAFFASAFGIVSLIYVIYIISQASYLFSAFTGHLPFGLKISVTEYARQGFFEMLKIALANFALIFLSVGICKRNGEKISPVITAFGVFLSAFNIMLCLISVSKILLYINTYGLTEKRLLVFIADLVLVVVFTTIIIRFFVPKLPYMQIILFAGSVAITVTALMGVNSTVSRYNADAVISGKIENISFEDMYEDSGDAAIVQIQKIADSNVKSSDEAKIFLKTIYQSTASEFIGANYDLNRLQKWYIERSKENSEIVFALSYEDMKYRRATLQVFDGKKLKTEKSFEIDRKGNEIAVNRSELSGLDDGDEIKIKIFLDTGASSGMKAKEVDMRDFETFYCYFGRIYNIDIYPSWPDSDNYEAY